MAPNQSTMSLLGSIETRVDVAIATTAAAVIR